MRKALAAAGVLAAALLVGVGAYASQAEPASGTTATSVVLPTPDDSPSPSAGADPSPSATPQVGDDNGGLVDRDLRTEPGDDRDVRASGDDGGYDDHGRGGDDSDDGWDDDSGRGGDDDGPDHD